MKWIKCKDKEPNSGAAFRVPFFYKGEKRDWMYFNGAVNEYDQVYDVDSAIPDVDQNLVEWLDESPSTEVGQDELWIALFNYLDNWSRSWKGSGDTIVKIKKLQKQFTLIKK